MKKVLFLTLEIIFISIMSTMSYAQYTTAGDSTTTMQIPTIMILDLSGDISWITPTAADLNTGYTLKSAATSFVVNSNGNWKVTIKATGGTSGANEYFKLDSTTSDLPVTALHWKSHLMDAGDMDSTTVHDTAWIDFSADGSCTTNVAEGTPGGEAQFIMDYKIDVDWKTPPSDAQSYTLTLTYTLEAD